MHNYLYDECHEKNVAGNDAICSWSTKDLDCPAKGCPSLQITFPDFKPDDAQDHHRPPPSDDSWIAGLPAGPDSGTEQRERIVASARR